MAAPAEEASRDWSVQQARPSSHRAVCHMSACLSGASIAQIEFHHRLLHLPPCIQESGNALCAGTDVVGGRRLQDCSVILHVTVAPGRFKIQAASSCAMLKILTVNGRCQD